MRHVVVDWLVFSCWSHWPEQQSPIITDRCPGRLSCSLANEGRAQLCEASPDRLAAPKFDRFAWHHNPPIVIRRVSLSALRWTTNRRVGHVDLHRPLEIN